MHQLSTSEYMGGNLQNTNVNSYFEKLCRFCTHMSCSDNLIDKIFTKTPGHGEVRGTFHFIYTGHTTLKYAHTIITFVLGSDMTALLQ